MEEGDNLKEINVSLREKLPRGTLLWVYADDYKIYRSSKRFDTASFNEHDSNYVGDFNHLYTGENKSLIYKMFEKTDRIYGVCLKANEKLENIKKSDMGDTVKFFPTWDDMFTFAEHHFKKADKIMARREEMKRQWLKRGRKYVQQQK